MSNETLQNVAVGLIVVAAIGFLVWKRVRRKARPSPLCGDCPACATADKARDNWALVGTPTPRPRHARPPRG